MSFDYFDSANGRLAARLDKAWNDYRNDQMNAKRRRQALDFMIYVFDLRTVSEEPYGLNAQLTELMKKREEKKGNNPEYIPIMYSGMYDFEHTARILLAATEVDASLRTELVAGTLLEVKSGHKQKDREGNYTYLDASERSKFRLEIRHGLLCKHGKPFDSSQEIAHEKKGYVAYTLNANGELSVFSHLNGVRNTKGVKLAHSSMNAGAPVLAAGEMEIRKGKIVRINTFSGHYEPSLYSIARFLNYLNVRSVDLSKTHVLLQNPPNAQTGLMCTERKIVGDSDPWFEVPAVHVMTKVESVINHNISSINAYLDSDATKLYQILNVTTTQAKVRLAKEFQGKLEAIAGAIKRFSNSGAGGLDEALEKVDKLIDEYQKLNDKITVSGRLTDKLSQMKSDLKAVKEDPYLPDEDEIATKNEELKGSF